tara:strand:+ start:9860 stop:10177 length:318 start_codon:yes stop_codon:yes gene_type:complete
MARNGLAGTKRGTSSSALYYQRNPEARKKKQDYDAENNKTKKSIAYRCGLNAANNKDPKSKVGDGKDMGHKKKKGKKGKKDIYLALTKQSDNRAGNSKNDVNSRV